MTSLRHIPDLRLPDPRLLDHRLDGYLDVARDCILDMGWRRTTLTEVARRAGVSRMTIYRAWPDMGSLLADLMTREWGGVAASTRTVGDTRTPEGIASSALATVRALRDNELFVRIVELDPELLLPYLLVRRGRAQQSLVDFLATEIAAGQQAGGVRSGDPTLMARSIVLAGHGFVFSVLTMVDDEVGLDGLDAELHRLLTRTLQP